jgi:hypothetical protein
MRELLAAVVIRQMKKALFALQYREMTARDSASSLSADQRAQSGTVSLIESGSTWRLWLILNELKESGSDYFDATGKRRIVVGCNPLHLAQ